MADRPTSEKMAVATDNQMVNQSASRDEIDQRYQINSPRMGQEGFPKKKGTFKITSVKLNDADADSMDDLDESHTEMTEDPSSDMLDISRSTDITPSEESIGSAMINDMVVPSKEASESTSTSLPGKEVPEVTEVKAKSGTDMHSRFRVVKIETKEPFHRGRWVCHDFLDPAPSASSVSTERTDTKFYDEANSGGSSSAGSSIHYVHGVDDPSKNPLLAGATGTIPVPSQVVEGHGANKHETFQPIHPAPSTASNQQVMSSSVLGNMPVQGYYTDTSQGQSQVSIPVSQSQTHQSISTVSTTDGQQSTSQLKSGQAPQEGITGQVQQGNPIISNHTPLDNINVGNIPQPNVYLPHSHYSSVQPGDSIPGSSISLQSVVPPIIKSTAHIVSDGVVSASTSIAQLGQNQGQASDTYQTFVHLGNQQIANSHVSQSGQSEIMAVGTSLAATSEAQPTSTIPDASRSSDQSNKDHRSDVRTATHFSSFPLNEVLDKDLNVIQNNTSLLSPFAAAVGDLQGPQEEESRKYLGSKLQNTVDLRGSSTVAIDNKIEQAMDLVKSHLMFAVREEVEVLKEQINELIERNNQLEYENSILRAAASQETLAKLSQPRQPPPSSSS